MIGGMTEFTQIMPILLIGLGVDYAIHLTSRYREELGGGARVATAIGGSITAVGGALVLATATTALSFLTNVVNPIPTLRDFGVLAAVGIVASFLVMLTVVPAARLLLDRRAEWAGRLPAPALGHTAERLLPRLMGRTAVLAERAPVPTLLVTLALAGVGVVGLTQLETRFSTTDLVPDDSLALEVLDELAERFDGGYGELTDVLVTGDIATPDVHNALVDAHGALAGTDDVVVHGAQPAARSIVTLLASLVVHRRHRRPDRLGRDRDDRDGHGPARARPARPHRLHDRDDPDRGVRSRRLRLPGAVRPRPRGPRSPDGVRGARLHPAVLTAYRRARRDLRREVPAFTAGGRHGRAAHHPLRT